MFLFDIFLAYASGHNLQNIVRMVMHVLRYMLIKQVRLKHHSEVRFLIVEKFDRLGRNCTGWVCIRTKQKLQRHSFLNSFSKCKFLLSFEVHVLVLKTTPLLWIVLILGGIICSPKHERNTRKDVKMCMRVS